MKRQMWWLVSCQPQGIYETAGKIIQSPRDTGAWVSCGDSNWDIRKGLLRWLRKYWDKQRNISNYLLNIGMVYCRGKAGSCWNLNVEVFQVLSDAMTKLTKTWSSWFWTRKQVEAIKAVAKEQSLGKLSVDC